MTTKTRIRVAVLALLALAVIVPVAAYGRGSGGPRTERQVDALVSLTTGFTFQGRLTDAGVPANGVYDFNFYLYDALAGGAQIGPVQTAGDVTVSAGLFTVALDFGNVFHGGQYFLDIQVRPGASAGAYTILSPREPISAVPNASFALEAASANSIQGVPVSASVPAAGEILKFDGTKWAPAAAGGGAFALPFAASQSFAGGLLKVTNTGTGSTASAIVAEATGTGLGVPALLGHITSTSPGISSVAVKGENSGTGPWGIGVSGTQDGTGYGVYGETPGGRGVYGTSNTGIGVYGHSSSGTGGYFSSSTGEALQVSGPIKVSGGTPAAFVHMVSAAGSHVTVIDNPATNGNPTAIVMVTQYWTAVYNAHPIGVYYVLGKWAIFNEDLVDLPLNAKFNVLVINR